MIPLCDLHTHTVFCDGKNTPQEMAEAALGLGMTALGFSAHGHTPEDLSYCIKKEREEEYRAEILRLKEAYRGRLAIFLGCERDHSAGVGDLLVEYSLGACHYLRKNGRLYPVDLSEKSLISAVHEGFGGDYYAAAEAYYASISELWRVTDCDIVAHFDLITKFNEGGALFDEGHRRYRAAASDALDSLLRDELFFEINTGAIARGYRKDPYPALPYLKRIRERGGRIVLSGDTHSAKALGLYYEAAVEYARAAGFRSAWTLGDSGFYEYPIL
jgi:histidinol-phosphatase (PHP family)